MLEGTGIKNGTVSKKKMPKLMRGTGEGGRVRGKWVGGKSPGISPCSTKESGTRREKKRKTKFFWGNEHRGRKRVPQKGGRKKKRGLPSSRGWGLGGGLDTRFGVFHQRGAGGVLNLKKRKRKGVPILGTENEIERKGGGGCALEWTSRGWCEGVEGAETIKERQKRYFGEQGGICRKGEVGQVRNSGRRGKSVGG